MSDKILIVEDQWIEANDLQIILESSGFGVTGIAKSVDQALSLIAEQRPDMVLLDIFLKGELTGIDLAKTLADQKIPFIYLTANSDSITLEAAKSTQPYGFLVKPYRERDILVALEIAGYRYKSQLEVSSRQQKWLVNRLRDIIISVDGQKEKLIQVAKAFETLIPLCFMMVDLNLKQDNMSTAWLLKRSGYDEFQPLTGWDMLDRVSLNSKEYLKFRKASISQNELSIDTIFGESSNISAGVFPSQFVETFKAVSCLYIPLPETEHGMPGIYFFSTIRGVFNNDHVGVAKSVYEELTKVIENVIEEGEGIQAGKKKSKSNAALPRAVEGIIGNSPKLQGVLALVGQVAPADTTVLISGETGVGKEGLANSIHQLSERRSKPFVKINCAAIPSGLIEAELFGHERGSYTGASDRRIGRFEQAQGGTIFLDEIGEIPMDVQSKLLRVLQEKELERIGGRHTIKLDVRIIAATNRNLYMEVAAGRFRIDLYYRLNVFPILLPPLRERKTDIPLLTNHFLQELAGRSVERAKRVSSTVMEQLLNYSWPGNIRELQNLIERHALMTNANMITEVDLPNEELLVQQKIMLTTTDLETSEREKIESTLIKTHGKISGSGGAALMLGLTPAVLSSRMRKLGIVWKYNFQ